MPKFTVKYYYVVNHYGTVEVEAADAEEAKLRVVEDKIRDEYEWEDEVVFDFSEVVETPKESEEQQ